MEAQLHDTSLLCRVGERAGRAFVSALLTDHWQGKRIALFQSYVDFKGESHCVVRIAPSPIHPAKLGDDDSEVAF